MCRSTFFGDTFRPADWANLYAWYGRNAAYPKLVPTYGAPDVVDLLDEDPSVLEESLFFHPDAESERKANEAAERKRLQQIAETPEETPPDRDLEEDMKTIGGSLFNDDSLQDGKSNEVGRFQ